MPSTWLVRVARVGKDSALAAPCRVRPVAFPAEPRAPGLLRSRGTEAAALALTPRGGELTVAQIMNSLLSNSDLK